MNLRDIYQDGGTPALRELAANAGTSPKYLWQCAAGWRGATPSRKLVKRLIKAEPRLTWEDIFTQNDED